MFKDSPMGKLYHGNIIASLATVIVNIDLRLQLSVLTADHPEQTCGHYSDQTGQTSFSKVLIPLVFWQAKVCRTFSVFG